MSRKRSQPTSSTTPDDGRGNDNYSVSSSIDDRRSTFIGYFSPSLPASKLQALPLLESASHRVAAWRMPSKQTTLGGNRGIFDTGHDDDGEQWAGKKLEKVLEDEEITGSVVVARWYGGVLLGPVRFKHIEDSAKDAIKTWRLQVVADSSKKRKLDSPPALEISTGTMDPLELKRQKQSLIEELKRRDSSITVLRDLLHEKKNKMLQGDAAKNSSNMATISQSPPASIPDYSSMPFVRLQALEKARDATIAFLLKEINKVEETAKFEKELEEEDLDEAWELMEASNTDSKTKTS